MDIEAREWRDGRNEVKLSLTVEPGSHLFFRTLSGADVYLDWHEVPETVRKKALRAKKEIELAMCRAADELMTGLLEEE